MAPFTPSGDNYSDTGGMEKPLEYWHRFRYIKDEDLNRINGNRTGLTQSRKENLQFIRNSGNAILHQGIPKTDAKPRSHHSWFFPLRALRLGVSKKKIRRQSWMKSE